MMLMAQALAQPVTTKPVSVFTHDTKPAPVFTHDAHGSSTGSAGHHYQAQLMAQCSQLKHQLNQLPLNQYWASHSH